MAFLNSDIGFYLPVKMRTNTDISNLFPEWDSNKIYEKIGISNRFICSENETSLDLAIESFKNLKNKIGHIRFDLILYVSNSSISQAPGDGHKFISSFPELSKAGCVDVNLGCSGYTYALGMANSLVDSNSATNILIITTDAYSKFINPKDKGNMTLFGDGSTATVVSQSPISKYCWQISNFKFGSDGSGYDDLVINKKKNDFNRIGNLFMDGQKIFKFTSNTVIEFIKSQSLKLNNHKVIFHQANAFMLNYMRKKLDIRSENFIISFQNYGNTVSSSIPLALNDNILKVKRDFLFLCGFGIGASYSSILLKPYNNK